MTAPNADPARLAAERWLAEAFYSAHVKHVGGMTVPHDRTMEKICARIAADFAEKMVAARDKEWVDVVLMTMPSLPTKVTITSPLPWAEAMKEES